MSKIFCLIDVLPYFQFTAIRTQLHRSKWAQLSKKNSWDIVLSVHIIIAKLENQSIHTGSVVH